MIRLKLDRLGILAVVEILDNIVYNELTFEQKLVLSIITDVDEKFKKAAIKFNKFNLDKIKTISLKYHEAYALEKIILNFINTIDDPLYRNYLHQIKDFINQKIC